jgi:hypothetical protein
MPTPLSVLIRLCLLLFAFALSLLATISAAQAAGYTRLLNPLDSPHLPGIGGWQVEGVTVRRGAGMAPQFGDAAVEIAGVAKVAGGKVDATLFDGELRGCRQLSLWVAAGEASNAAAVGFQVRDAKGEWLLQTVPVDWIGWKRITIDPTAGGMRQAYTQKEGDGKVDLPLTSVHAIWFSKAAGSTALCIDALCATIDDAGDDRLSVSVLGENVCEPGVPFTLRLLAENHGTTEQAATVRYSLQTNPGYRDLAVPSLVVPQVGQLVASGTVAVSAPAGDFREIVIQGAEQLGPGAYLLGLELSGAVKDVRLSHLFVLPADTVDPVRAGPQALSLECLSEL